MSRHRYIRNLSREELLDDGLDDSDDFSEDDDDEEERSNQNSDVSEDATFSESDERQGGRRKEGKDAIFADLDEHDIALMQQVHETTADTFTDKAVYDALLETDGHVEQAIQLLFGTFVSFHS